MYRNPPHSLFQITFALQHLVSEYGSLFEVKLGGCFFHLFFYAGDELPELGVAHAKVTEAQAITANAKAENKKANKEARQEKEVVTEIEVKKKKAQISRKVKEKKDKVKAAVKKPIKKAKAAKMDLIFETNGGLQIKPEEIVEKVPDGCDAAYIKLEENKIYWVKGEETGSVNIW